MAIVWDGITQYATLREETGFIRRRLADAARSYDWGTVLALLAEHPEFVNASRPGGVALYAPLHQAAHGGAHVTVIRELLGLGAWRTLMNARGERSCDVAERHEQIDLIEILRPQLKRFVPAGMLRRVQHHFHAVIRGRAQHLVEKHALRLPELEPLLELDSPAMWFAVPEMYGGFSYRLEEVGVNVRLVSESWSRVVGGSGQRHEVTASHSRLVESGFV